jgi:hypothetical protein
MAAGHQQGNEMSADGAGSACEKDSHLISRPEIVDMEGLLCSPYYAT